MLATSNAALIITEFMADALAVNDAEGEYFEVFNSGSSAITISTLTIEDDGSDSLDLVGQTGTIGAGEFFVFGNHTASYVDFDYSVLGTYFLSNGADEIVITETSSGTELARLNYTNGDAPGDGIANVLNDIANVTGGVTSPDDYIGEISTFNTLTNGDVGSPGIFGSTVPEPSSTLLVSLAGFALLFRRRK